MSPKTATFIQSTKFLTRLTRRGGDFGQLGKRPLFESVVTVCQTFAPDFSKYLRKCIHGFVVNMWSFCG